MCTIADIISMHYRFEANCSTLHHPNLDKIILSYFFVSQFTQWVKLPCIGVQKQTSSQNKVFPFEMKYGKCLFYSQS